MIEGLTHKDLIDIESIPKDERKEYLDFFSEGSIELKRCLKTMWDMNLYTSACCKGHDLIDKVCIIDGEEYYFIDIKAYICMKPNNHISEYLSKKLIMDPYVYIHRFEDNREAIYIYGRDRFKKLNKLTRDLKTGKKDNKYLLDIYFNRYISSKIIRASYREYFYDNNFYFEEIRDIEKMQNILKLDLETNKLTDEEVDDICNEYNSILKRIRERNLSRGNNDKKHKKCNI